MNPATVRLSTKNLAGVIGQLQERQIPARLVKPRRSGILCQEMDVCVFFGGLVFVGLVVSRMSVFRGQSHSLSGRLTDPANSYGEGESEIVCIVSSNHASSFASDAPAGQPNNFSSLVS